MTDLDPAARRALGSLSGTLAELVGRHLVAAGRLVDEDPMAALAHARFARSKAGRIGLVREAAGVTAYHAEQWAEALTELRAARRMSGGPGMIAVMADCERALGRPERALELLRSPEASQLPAAEVIELRIVAAGARRDLGELEAAVVALQGPDLDPKRRQPWSARLFYAYADNLAAAGRGDEAVRWFLNAAEADDEDETDASERASDLADELAGRTPPRRYAPVEEPAESRPEAVDGDDRREAADTARKRPVLEDPPEPATPVEQAAMTPQRQAGPARPDSAADADSATAEVDRESSGSESSVPDSSGEEPDPASSDSTSTAQAGRDSAAGNDETNAETPASGAGAAAKSAEAADTDTPEEVSDPAEAADPEELPDPQQASDPEERAADETATPAAEETTGTTDQPGTAGDR
ncbi:hypothetical protein FHR81_002400 [Actinoalloteichus hoggarensis]|uniref:Uncharacterized protein n=1 Tax=Actinoalloteichus hoggarensis TaxID=1470176 RepID=A0A221W779_9PSEU|nr:hypothetical protein [Actinoalloteichus hoggarensis]ASO21429.1 hypothetical protein AHOG_19020 [Actinoalloteichus hoggarensis]MBB5921362.1 hypothetical protein [Actinoalloteichus hoggarensis]